MKNYETGICVHCKGTMEMHNPNNPCLDFKDSGLAQLEKNAPKLLSELIELHESITEYLKSYRRFSADERNKALNRLRDAELSAKKVINEALKRE